MSVSARISPGETMMDGDTERYLDVGASAMRAIKTAPLLGIPQAILDFPCGHGRVTRHLRDAYPDAELFVSDLDEPGADFCAAEFNATKLVSSLDLSDIDFGRKFDLIWVGSLITHLDAQTTRDFFGFLSRHLSSQGSAIVTSHGPLVAGRLFLAQRSLYSDIAPKLYGIVLDDEAAILADYLAAGYGYQDYSQQKGYGISLASRHWIADAAGCFGLVVASHRDHAWDNHQDVVVLRHTAAAPAEQPANLGLPAPGGRS